MKKIIKNPKISSIRHHHYHYHKVFTSSSKGRSNTPTLTASNTSSAAFCESFLVNNKETIKKVLFLMLFAISESLPFLETDSNGIFHHIGNTLRKVTSNNIREE